MEVCDGGGIEQPDRCTGGELGLRGVGAAGLQAIERNWRCRLGEIDIVAAEAGQSGLTLVFCEVKCRSGLGFGHPLEAITYAKMRTLRQLFTAHLESRPCSPSAFRACFLI
jgi:putative endonuclease